MSERKRFYSKRSEKLADEALNAHRAGSRETDIHEIRKLEEKLRNDHADIVTRCALLGYYSETTQAHGPEVWCMHAEWLIKNCPDEMLIWFLRIPDSVSSDQYEALKKCFLEKVKRNPKNANVAGNAAHFLRLEDLELKIKLNKRAKRLAPDNYKWSSDLCALYSYEARLKKDTAIATKAFKAGEKFIKRFEKMPHHRSPVYLEIIRMCELALEMNDLERVAKYIKKLKNAEFDFISPYRKHFYKGLLALKEGNIEQAKSQLLKFARKKGRLRDLRLANQLLELGEVQTVLECMEICLPELYDENKEKLVKQWIKKLKKGQIVQLGFPHDFINPLWSL